jgi:hypothetical protein
VVTKYDTIHMVQPSAGYLLQTSARLTAAGKGWIPAVEGGVGSRRRWRRRCSVFLDSERCPAVFSNPNGLALAGWASPLGLLYTTRLIHPHRRSHRRLDASLPPSAVKPCCAACREAVLCRSTLLLCPHCTAVKLSCAARREGALLRRRRLLSTSNHPNRRLIATNQLVGPIARPANRTT